jgi:predicted nucleic acid-binding protein
VIVDTHIHLAYRRRGGSKTAPLPDFYIGAHAAVQAMKILTRDPKRDTSYFPSAKIIEP